MRSRYSAYVVGAIAYLQATTLPAQQQALDLQSMKEWSANSTWLGRDVLCYLLFIEYAVPRT